jgi:glycosyltransferase involved in cell wall biosynthesis
MTTSAARKLSPQITAATAPNARPRAVARPPQIELVMSVHNDERVLRESVNRLHQRLALDFDVPVAVSIVDLASNDGSAEIAAALSRELPGVRCVRTDHHGHGQALRTAWGASVADVVGAIDVNLAVDLAYLSGTLGPLLGARADIVVASRLAPGASVTAGPKHQIVARGYNALLGVLLGVGISDAACPMMAAGRGVIQTLLPFVAAEGRFFETELLYLAQRNGFSIREIPVSWANHAVPARELTRAAIDDFRCVARLHRRAVRGQDRIRALTTSPDAADPAPVRLLGAPAPQQGGGEQRPLRRPLHLAAGGNRG